MRPFTKTAMLLLLWLPLATGAQTASLNGGTTVPATDRENTAEYNRALHHFEHAQYAAALEGFDRFVRAPLMGDHAQAKPSASVASKLNIARACVRFTCFTRMPFGALTNSSPGTQNPPGFPNYTGNWATISTEEKSGGWPSRPLPP